MANPVCKVLLTHDALQAPSDTYHGSGAVIDFFGAVRPLEGEREISGIDYEAHQAMASHQMEQIARRAIETFDLHCAMIHHRVGFVPAGEASVFVRTTSRNRAEGYRANQWIMEELKKNVPIWKRPKFIGAESSAKREPESVTSR